MFCCITQHICHRFEKFKKCFRKKTFGHQLQVVPLKHIESFFRHNRIYQKGRCQEKLHLTSSNSFLHKFCYEIIELLVVFQI